MNELMGGFPQQVPYNPYGEFVAHLNAPQYPQPKRLRPLTSFKCPKRVTVEIDGHQFDGILMGMGKNGACQIVIDGLERTG